jgi:hypothetical protein
MEALPDTAPPTSRNAPKRKLTREESEAAIRRAGQMGPVSPRKRMDMEYSGKVQRKAKGGVIRGDGCAAKGHTKGRMR